MSDAANKALAEPKRRVFPRAFVRTLLVLGVLFTLFVLTGPVPAGIRKERQSAVLQSAHAIGLAMYSYANDNGGKYPDGKSSTEVFQKLLDGSYVSDPSSFYFPLAGKIKAVRGQKLKPENVCWDVTSDVSLDTPGEIPLIFVTGYKVNYVPGGGAVPVTKPYPLYGARTRSWWGWWRAEPPPQRGAPGIVVFYTNNSAMFSMLQTPAQAEASIPNFISPNFKPDGKTYRQLTPDGVLP